MRAAVITALTGPDAVEIQEVAEPEPKPNQVVVDVAYAGVVFPDVLQTRGQYQLRPDLPFTPGWEVSGVVRADAGGFRAGDRVAAMPVLGGLAETVAVGPHMVFPLPDTVPFDKGATLPLNYLTVHFALIRRARLKQGEIVLVHGAAGGVGTAACQLAAAYGAQVVAVVSTAAKGEVARAAGRTRSCRSMASATRCAGSPTAAASTSSWIRSAVSASPTRCAAWPARAGCSSSASPAVRSPRSRSIGCC